MTQESTREGMQRQSSSGLDAVPFLQWGSHLSQFLRSRRRLARFQSGPLKYESCLWVTSTPFGENQARSALRGDATSQGSIAETDRCQH
jgi:hypothetical protein